MRFRLFGFPITVSPTFLIVALFIGGLPLDGAEVVLWTVAAFATILIHEFGHAFAARGFGAEVHGIALQWIGGATYWVPEGNTRRGWRRFAISAAGPGVQLLMGLGLWLAISLGWFGTLLEFVMDHPLDLDVILIGTSTNEYGLFFVGVFTWASVAWALFNLLPVGGFDGSHMVRELLEMRIPDTAWLHSLLIGIATAVVGAVILYNVGLEFGAFLLLMFAGLDLMRTLRERRT